MIQTFYEIKKETYAFLTVICGIHLIVVLVVCLDLAPGSSILTLIGNKRKHTIKKEEERELFFKQIFFTSEDLSRPNNYIIYQKDETALYFIKEVRLTEHYIVYAL